MNFKPWPEPGSDQGLDIFFELLMPFLRLPLSHIWTLLCDSTPESLRGYGKLSPGQAELLHHHINNLLETVNELQPLIM